MDQLPPPPPPGWRPTVDGLDRAPSDQAARGRDARDRLISAMINASAAKGYEAATVADAVAAAGVTRDQFYEHFRSKQDCFLAGLDSILADVIAAVSGYYSPDKPWFQVVRDGVESLLELLEQSPAHAKIALLETPPAGAPAFERYAAGKRVLVSLVDQGRADAPDDVILPPSAAQLAFGAAEAVIADELLVGRSGGLRRLLPELLYALYVPFMEQAQAISLSGIPLGDPKTAEAGEAAFDPTHVDVELPGPGRRTELIEAMIKVSVHEGYEGATVEKVIAEAGVDHEEFYEFFPDKQTCFLATFDFIFDHVVYSVREAFEAELELAEQARAALAALLDWFSAEPRMAHLAIVGMISAGPAAHRHYRRSVQRFLPLFAAGKSTPMGDRLPPGLSRLALGSITELLFDEIKAGRTERLPEKLPDLVYASLVPYLGTREASAQMLATPTP